MYVMSLAGGGASSPRSMCSQGDPECALYSGCDNPPQAEPALCSVRGFCHTFTMLKMHQIALHHDHLVIRPRRPRMESPRMESPRKDRRKVRSGAEPRSQMYLPWDFFLQAEVHTFEHFSHGLTDSSQMLLGLCCHAFCLTRAHSQRKPR